MYRATVLRLALSAPILLLALAVASAAVAPAYADVLTLETDKSSYSMNDKIVFSGTESEGRESVVLIIRDPADKRVILRQDPSSDNFGRYEMGSVNVRDVFSSAGIYQAIAFTHSQPAKNGTSIYLDYDGKTVKAGKTYDLVLQPIRNKSVDEKNQLSFTVKINDPEVTVERYSLGRNTPSGASIDPETGVFTWVPTEEHGPGSYLIDILVKAGLSSDSQTVKITVNEVVDPTETMPEMPSKVPPETPFMPKGSVDKEDAPVRLAPFVDPAEDPQSYVDRYLGEKAYREWFDAKFPEYSSIYEAVGLRKPLEPAPFVDPDVDPHRYVERYMNEETYQKWFDASFPQYLSIYEAVGLPEPDIGICGNGTVLEKGVCTVVTSKAGGANSNSTKEDGKGEEGGGGCLIATAAYGSEMAPQVQILREIRDDVVLGTHSGNAFMAGFNQFYYSFSPTVADWERQNPAFREAVRIAITPLVSSLAIMSHAESESEVIGYGMAVMALNAGMYLAIPAVATYKLAKVSTRMRDRFFHAESPRQS